MSDYHRPHTSHTCRVARRCIYCGESINKGDGYTQQTGYFEGSPYRNHYHPECFDDMCESGDEFMPYSNDRPQVAGAEKQA